MNSIAPFLVMLLVIAGAAVIAFVLPPLNPLEILVVSAAYGFALGAVVDLIIRRI